MPPSEDVPATVASGTGQAEEVAVVDPPVATESRKRGRDRIDVNAPPKSLRRDHSNPRPSRSSHGGKSGNGITTALEIRTRGKAAEEVRVSNERLSQQVATLQQQVSREEKLKAAFEELKRQQDEKVEQRCAEMDARLDALSIDFDEELYPHMLTAIAGRRWVIGRGLRLVMMKCSESLELRQAFADAVSAGITKGLSEGLSLKDTPMDVIMVALYLEIDTGDDASQDIRDLHPSSSQLTIPVYPKVRNPQNPWACKEEIVLADAITTNISRAKKKKKCRIVCHTHGVGSAHHARSDDVPVSAPTVVPQGLALLLADAATQTKLEDDT
nr:hypothetical protein [Tanacetum cinerariifolium]